MIENYSTQTTPTTTKNWTDRSVEERIKLISNELKKNKLYENFEPIKAPDNGQVVIRVEKIIPANERGLLLLELEQKLKSNIDVGITIWCEPVGDKSKLRKLRGIQINS
tara:strand:+ start:83 stop:409 length:327 start_codon:yes stop_codon:yes gene_type:complete